jgi:hypothetical protein
MIQSFHQEKVALLLAKNAENIKQLRVNYDELNATLKSLTTDITSLHTAREVGKLELGSFKINAYLMDNDNIKALDTLFNKKYIDFPKTGKSIESES